MWFRGNRCDRPCRTGQTRTEKALALRLLQLNEKNRDCPYFSFLSVDVEGHLADVLDAAFELVARCELGDAGRRTGGNEVPRPQGDDAAQEADVVAHAADHVLGMRGHDVSSVQLDEDPGVLRLGQL